MRKWRADVDEVSKVRKEEELIENKRHHLKDSQIDNLSSYETLGDVKYAVSEELDKKNAVKSKLRL